MSATEQKIIEQIRNLELSLLDSETRKNRTTLREILDDDFLEIGASGTRYTKRQIIEFLADEAPKAVTMSDERVRILTDDIVQFTYRTSISTSSSVSRVFRSSIWRKFEGGWKILFHQGTKLG